MDCQATFRRQVENELESMAANPDIATKIKSAIMYETSLELINEVLTEQGVGKNLCRIESVSRSVSTLVVKDVKAFSHLFALSQHDFYTATHMVNVGTWMTSLAYAMGITEPAELSAICMAGMVHDVGKMFVPAEVLNKTGKLAEGEWEELRAHPGRGTAHLMAQGVTNHVVLRVAAEHHERLDGTGYPSQLRGSEMHVASKICAVVDSFDAMTSCRPFKNKVKTIAEAVEVLRAEAPKKYDPAIVEMWVGLLRKASAEGGIEEPVEKPGPGNPGRRVHERFAIDCPVRFHALRRGSGGTWTEGPPSAAKAHNVSAGGLGLLSEKAVPVSDYIRVYLNGKGTLKDRTMEGMVVHCRAYNDGWHDVGVKLCKAGEQEKASSEVLENCRRDGTMAGTR